MRRWPAIPVLLALVLVGRSAAPAWGQSPADSPVTRALAQGIDLDVTKTSLDNVLAYIAKAVPGLNLSVGKEVKQAGIDLTARVVDLKVQGVPVQDVLELVLGADLPFKAEPAGVRVTTRKWLLGDLSTATYSVSAIMRMLMADTAFSEDVAGMELYNASAGVAQNVLEQHWQGVIPNLLSVRAFRDVASWEDEKGKDRIQYNSGVLTVTQTQPGHRRVAEVLVLLERALDLAARSAKAARPVAAQPVVALPEPEAATETRRRLEETIDLDFEKTSLDNVLKYISEVQRGLNIVIDPDLATAGVDLSTRVVDLKEKHVTVGVVLDLVLGADLAYEVRPGFVQITARKLLETRMAVRFYPVADLLKAAADETARYRNEVATEETPWGLVGLVQRFASNQSDPSVAVWWDEGGAAAAETLGGVLIVRQTARGHEQVLGLLNHLREALRVAAAQTPAPPVVPPEPESVVSVRRGLARPIDVEFDRVALDAALEHVLKMRRDLNIVIDPAVADAGIDLAVRPVTVRLRQVPTAAALEAILPPHLAYAVGPGYVLVTTRETVQRDLLLGVYPVARVAKALGRTAARRDWQDLIFTVPRVVNRVSDPDVAVWADEGGPAGIECFGGHLVVTQTRQGHARLAALLDALLAALAWQEGVGSGVTDPVQRVFAPADARAEVAARLLEVSVDVGFRDVSLVQAVRTLATQPPGLNLVLDRRVQGAGIDPAYCRVTVAPGRRPLRVLLKEMLPSTMGYCARPGYVLLTTREDAWQAMPLVLYPVRDLMDRELRRRGKNIAEVKPDDVSEVLDDLVGAVQRAANASADPDVAAWADEGGPAELTELGDVLIIRQTARGQSRVLECLNDVRAGRLVLGRQPASPRP